MRYETNDERVSREKIEVLKAELDAIRTTRSDQIEKMREEIERLKEEVEEARLALGCHRSDHEDDEGCGCTMMGLALLCEDTRMGRDRLHGERDALTTTNAELNDDLLHTAKVLELTTAKNAALLEALEGTCKYDFQCVLYRQAVELEMQQPRTCLQLDHEPRCPTCVARAALKRLEA